MLSDEGSRVILQYGILNDRIGEAEGALLYGIPYPGAFVTDERGIVVAKFFNDSYKKRESPELYIDAALGKIVLADDVPQVTTHDPEVRITAAVHGGKGSMRQGILRKLVVRFELAEGMHLYGEPVPEGMIPTTILPEGPPGVIFGDPVYPPTESLRLPGLDVVLPVFTQSFDIAVPFYPDSRVVSEMRPLDSDHITIEVQVRYQACDGAQCLMPKTEKLSLDVPLEVVDLPRIDLPDHIGHGHRESGYDGMPHLRRLIWRSIKRNPFSFLRFLKNNLSLELAARRRLQASKRR